MKYEVLKPFFKNSEQKNYEIGDTIELSEEDAANMVKYDLVKDLNPKPKKLITEVSKKDIESVLIKAKNK